MIKDNILKVKAHILSACSRFGHDAGSITIVGVSKGRTIEEIQEAADSGIPDIGENKVQEAILKFNEIRSRDPENSRTITWHMVGHLQTNKVKEAVRIFDLIQSVDSARLAKEIDKEALKLNKVQDILIEVKTSPEATKYGIGPDLALGLIQELSKLKNINIKGLMTIAPLVDNPEKARPYFKMLRELRDEIQDLGILDLGSGILSMGMTDDFEVAIEEGANMVRIGRAIFEG